MTINGLALLELNDFTVCFLVFRRKLANLLVVQNPDDYISEKKTRDSTYNHSGVVVGYGQQSTKSSYPSILTTTLHQTLA